MRLVFTSANKIAQDQPIIVTEMTVLIGNPQHRPTGTALPVPPPRQEEFRLELPGYLPVIQATQLK